MIEIQQLEIQVREAKTYIQALQDTVKLLPRENGSAVQDFALRKGSSPALARDVLEKAGKNLHITDILKGIGKEPSRQNRISLAGSLNAYARKGIIFTAEGQNIFGLIGKNGDEPPAEFGVIANDEEVEEEFEEEETPF